MTDRLINPLFDTNLWTLLEAQLGTRRTEALFEAVAVPASLLTPWKPRVTRAQLAMALDLMLFEDLVNRVPTAQAYVKDRVRQGGQVVFDHGALRTVKAFSGALPEGKEAFLRILEPLGYHVAEVYPLTRLAMTGFALTHRDFPELIPQFFLSEFHPEGFSPEFQAAVRRTLSDSRDPLPAWCRSLLDDLKSLGALSQEQALRLLPNLVACFGCHHAPPLLEDYRTLKAESDEMAWIATEGNAFNHVTDRVPDVETVSREQLAWGRPMKAAVEVSQTGRVLQSAFRAAVVERPFLTPDGHLALERVPGSFYEFITRRALPDGHLDLGFDSGNAQEIFKMTSLAGDEMPSPDAATLLATSWVGDLQSIVGEAGVLTEPEDLEKYESGWRYGKGRALMVVRPATTGEVAGVLAFCRARGLRLVAQGANTGLVGAGIPDGGGSMGVLSLERLNRRLEVSPEDRAVTVDAGVLLSSLNRALADHGLQFPVDLGADPQIGGMIATNTGGTRFLRYGDVRHNLLGLEVVLGDGTVVDALGTLRKNNTGLDFKQLFTGTSGLFGVITGAVLQAVPLPRQRAVAWVGLESGEAALRLIQALEAALGDLLGAFEVVSAEALAPVFTHQPRLRSPYGASGLPPYTALVEVASTLPEAILDLPGALEATLCARLEDGLTEVFLGQDEAFWAIRHHVSESLRGEGKVLAFDISVPRSLLPAFTGAVRHWLRVTYPFMRVCDFGHWADGGTHLNLVWREGDAPLPAEDLVPLVQRHVYDLATGEFKGSYSAEHGVGPHNQAYYDLYTAPAVKAAGAVLKAHFDPGGLLGVSRMW